MSSSISVLFLILAVSSAFAQSSYAEDRALIEELEARYMYTMDFEDVEGFALLFSKDGVLEVNEKVVLKGREAIRKSTQERLDKILAQRARDTSGLPPSNNRYHLTTITLMIDGDNAIGTSYWFRAGNDNPERKAGFRSHGHYEDKFVKEDGKWFF